MIYLSADEQGRPFIKIADKRETSVILSDDVERYCPPHRIPHSLPIIGKKVCDEPCHVHESKFRQYSHHEPFCLMLGCKNYEVMRRARELFYSKG